MKKIAVLMVSLLSLTSVVLAADKGLGIRVGWAENDPEFEYGGYEKPTTQNEVFGVEALEEWNLSNEVDKIGVKLGLEFYGKNKLKDNFYGWDGVDNTYAFPFTVYYKQDFGINRLSWFVGGGVTLIKTKATITGSGARDSRSKHKFFPHITAGVEYRISELFGLGVDGKYNIGAKMNVYEDEYIKYTSDRSGLSAAVTARYYF